MNDQEMPPGQDLIVLKIPDLCIGGSAVGSNVQNGYVVFVRRGSGIDKMRFQFTKSMLTLHQLVEEKMLVLTYLMGPIFLTH